MNYHILLITKPLKYQFPIWAFGNIYLNSSLSWIEEVIDRTALINKQPT